MYDKKLTVRDALAIYFSENKFDASSYTSPTFPLKLLGRILTLPNPPPRQKGIKVHDLHHIATGYATDMGGEAEIGAFELGAGFGSYPAAAFFNTTAFLMGLLFFPLRTLKAYARGVATERSLYHVIRPGDSAKYNRVLDWSVGYIIAHMHVRTRFAVVVPVLLRLPLILSYALIGLLLYPVLGLVISVAFLFSKRAQ